MSTPPGATIPPASAVASAAAAAAPTLLAVEAGWLGPVAPSSPLDLRKSERDAGLTLRALADARVAALLAQRSVVAPLALVDEEAGARPARLVCFVGRDKSGEAQRIYDIVSALHEAAAPHDGQLEAYDSGYVRLIVERSRHYRRWLYSAIDEEDPRRRQELTGRADDRARAWCREEVVAYMNRSFGYVADTTQLQSGSLCSCSASCIW